MDTTNTKSPSDLADEAKQTGQDAANTARAYGQEAKQLGRDAVDSASAYASDAKQTARDAVDTGKAYAKDAVDAGKSYAQGAVNAAGRKINDLKDQVGKATEQGAAYVADQPVRSVLIAAAGGALLTAFFLTLMRNDRR